ncbi:MAG: protein translocase subunit SecD [Candidatus Hydrogenedentes bacterium]|nr:protein translocase subunit SecD [Candidatus Hydrogenedentota bacterium]
MKKHLYRTLANIAIIIVSLVLCYPTIGWMMMSPERKEAVKALRKAEDEQEKRHTYWGDNLLAVKRWARCDPDFSVKLGLDLQGGIHMVLGLDKDAVDKLVKEQNTTVKDIQQMALRKIQRRVDEFEAKEPIISTVGDSQIQVQLPGEKDVDRAKTLIMKVAYLTFHIVSGTDETTKVFNAINDHFNKEFIPYLSKPVRGSFVQVKPENYARVRRIVEQAAQVPGLIPDGKTIAFSQKPNAWDPEQVYTIYLMTKDPAMTGETLSRAMARTDTSSGAGWMINFENNAEGAKKCREVTKANINKPMAITLDGYVISAPTIQGVIGASGQITGNFTQEQASDLAIALNSGAMPVPLKEDFTGIVGASLGEDSIRAGVTSSIAGLLCVVGFMLVYYRFAGLVANIGLFVNGIMLLGAMAYTGSTLTLPGIAGFILTMGMAVDANVLIYERIREELRNGKSLLAAVESGYTRATGTIIDTHATTLIAALVLMQFGTGPVQGFAITLCIGVLTSVYSSLFITHAVFNFWTDRGWLKKLTMMSLIPHGTKFPFIEKRMIGFIVTAVLIVIGLVSFGIRGSNNFGVDFTSGTNMQIRLAADTPIHPGKVRELLAAKGFKDATVQEFSQGGALNSNEFLIRFGDIGVNEAGAAVDGSGKPVEAPATAAGATAAPDTISSRVQQTLAPLCKVQEPNQVELKQVSTVGPVVGAQLKKDAVLANVYSWFFIILYLTFRFEYKFGIMAVFAVVHDVLIAVGALSITGRQISMPVIAAVLTIIGYSVNDTVVVFDRIREELKAYRGRGYSLLQIMNISINETLSRTILTSLTVFFVVVVLYFFGGSSMQDFAFVMIVGVVTGTYSSIFVASALVYEWQRRIKAPGATIVGVKSETTPSTRRRNIPKNRTITEKTEEPTSTQG